MVLPRFLETKLIERLKEMEANKGDYKGLAD